MAETTGRPTQRDDLLDAGIGLIRAGQAVSMDTVARAAGLTKPGLMYHFPTKRDLMIGLVDRVIDRYEADLTARLPATDGPPAPRDLIEAYLRWAIETPSDGADLVMLSDPRLRDPLLERWEQRLHRWVDVPEDLPPAERDRLQAVRMMADGCWFADAADYRALRGGERDGLLRVGLSLLDA